MKRVLFTAFVITLCFCDGSMASAQNSSSLKVLEGKTGNLQNFWMLKRLGVQFDHRRAEVQNASKSVEKLLARRDNMRKWFVERVGELPPKSPLNPVYGKKIDMGSYVIEPVHFESQPNHHITGLFYTPISGKPPYPAVYIPCGHSFDGKASGTYQSAARLFAMNGFVVLQGDPICQGERHQHLDKDGKPFLAGGGTLAHELLGQSLLLTGSNSLIRELTDNIRCIDFLEQHPAVDKEKIAVAGNSGGGTQTTYLAAYDRRIKVAVPSCYIATTEKKFNTIGSQDGCQQLWGEGKAGIEEQDFLFMAAPVPILVLSAKQDFFNIDGAVSAYNELKGLYSVLGSADQIGQVINDSPHGWHKPMREAAVQWCKRWLMNDPSPVIEPDDIGKLDNITASPTGQVLTSFPNEKSVTDISIERMGKARLTRSAFQKANTPAQITTVIKSLCGFEEPAKVTRSEKRGVIQGNGYVVEKLLLERDTKSKFSLPALLIIPDKAKAKSPGVIIISENGKDSVLTPDCQIMKELAKGNVVLAIDLSNTGELKHSGRIHYDNNEFWMGKLALYEGKTLMTYRAEEVIMAKRFLKNHPKVNKNSISIHSTGLTGPSALHAAFIDQGFREITVTESIISWEDVASADYSKNQLANIVPGVLNYYDLPDLIRWTSGTKIEIDSPVDALGKLKKN